MAWGRASGGTGGLGDPGSSPQRDRVVDLNAAGQHSHAAGGEILHISGCRLAFGRLERGLHCLWAIEIEHGDQVVRGCFLWIQRRRFRCDEALESRNLLRQWRVCLRVIAVKRLRILGLAVQDCQLEHTVSSSSKKNKRPTWGIQKSQQKV